MRFKLICDSVNTDEQGYQTVIMSAARGKGFENLIFATYTPEMHFSMRTKLKEEFQAGEEYYLEFVKSRGQ